MKRLITIVVMLLVSAGYIGVVHFYKQAQAETNSYIQTIQNETEPVSGPKTVEVYLKKIYLDGETAVNVKPVTIWSMEDFWSRFSDWKLVDQNQDEITFKKRIDDISPLLKADGYFGLSPENLLKIYKGKPSGNEAVHSFFHIDVKELESDLRQELREGIPVKTKNHYKKVINRLKKYAVKEQ
ncbi:MAG TPA: BofC C-terminal domain-containing protein [Bacillales bacterium]|nr:BofC C-terminal domain-containing protein [Bacillales bacterium]